MALCFKVLGEGGGLWVGIERTGLFCITVSQGRPKGFSLVGNDLVMHAYVSQAAGLRD